ncbi:unnamed protein product [Polarella glacialis]|uniref:J domain-containing protein n=1 Tax=Polarella glacialis TaxID=89957 RepID=A0A813F9C6_POLGL|nr:unnamed protein product [Polarella glacialis]
MAGAWRNCSSFSSPSFSDSRDMLDAGSRVEDEFSFPGLGALLASPDRRGDGFVEDTPPKPVRRTRGFESPRPTMTPSRPAFAAGRSPGYGEGEDRNRSQSSRSPVQLPAGALQTSSCSRVQATRFTPPGGDASPGEAVEPPEPGHQTSACSRAAPGSFREAPQDVEDDSPGEIVLRAADCGSRSSGCRSGSTVAREAEVARLRDAAAAAMRLSCEEIAALRAENERLRVTQQSAESEVARLQRKLETQQLESDALRRQLDADRRRHARAAGAGQAQSGASGGRQFGYGDENKAPRIGCAGSEEELLAKQLASMELLALASAVQGEDRARQRKRLQLKWHPDKNVHNAAFATRVLQEMQRQPEWQ